MVSASPALGYLWLLSGSVFLLACGEEGAAVLGAAGSAGKPAVAGSSNPSAGGVSGGPPRGSMASDAGAAGSSSGGTAGSAGGSPSLMGAAGSTGGITPCGEPSTPEPEPAQAPALLVLSASATTALQAGNFDDAGTNVLEASAGAGFQRGARSGTALWQWAEAGAWLEYTVEASAAGSYSIVVMYYSAEPNGIATLAVDGASIGASHFGARDQVGEYGGVPGCCSRGHGSMAKLSVGTHKIRVTVSPRSVPLDVYGLQINFAGQELQNGGKVHVLSSATPSAVLPPDGAVDFYRMNFDAEKAAWPCEKSFCRVEYLVQPEQAGRYAVSLHYTKHDTQCMGVGFQLEDESLAVFQLEQDVNVTAPVMMDLKCGINRISIRDPNYVDGAFCSYGAMFGAVELSRIE
jgi:hypothetical protein